MKKSFVFVFLLIYINVYTQHYKFNHVSIDNGLLQKYVYDMVEDQSGFLWIATGEGLCRFDGIETTNFTSKHGLSENFVTKLFLDSKKNLWIGHNQGSVSCKKQNTFQKITRASGLGPITGFAEPISGCIVAASQNGKVTLYNNETVQTFDLCKEECAIYSLIKTADGSIMFFTSDGIYLMPLIKGKLKGNNFVRKLNAGSEKIQAVIRDKVLENVFWLGSASGIVQRGVLNDNKTLVLTTIPFDSNPETINEIVQAENGTLWLATYNGGMHVRYDDAEKKLYTLSHYNDKNGLPSNFVKTVLFDSEQNVWFGFYGEGMAMLKDVFFSFYPFAQPPHGSIRFLNIDRNEYWTGNEKGILYHDKTGRESFFALPAQITTGITCMCNNRDKIYAGTNGNGICVFDKNTHRWEIKRISTDNLLNQVTCIVKAGNKTWIGTQGGAFETDEDFKPHAVWNMERGLQHNSINSIFIDLDNSVWITTPGNMLSHITNGSLENIALNGASAFSDISCVARDAQGNLWIGTNGSGAFLLKNGKETQFKTGKGLKSDYVYSVTKGHNNDVWIGHRGTLTRIDIRTLKTEVFDDLYNTNSDFTTLTTFRDSSGHMWFGTTSGLLMFDYAKLRVNNVAPKLNLKNVWCADVPLDITKPAELPSGTYKVKFSFVGISLGQPQKVKYQFFLEGFDPGWSDFSETGNADYSRLEDGKYVFKVRAVNADGFKSEETSLFTLTILPPYWKTWWFLVLCVFFFFFSMATVIKLRERSQQRMLDTLESQLAIRTEELRNQKSIIEQKNKDITDSIHYAQRIQTCILPDIDALKTYLPESFVLYKPRDIVSGDFYWFMKKNQRLILVCADCTGHGVPGAFMSMIGNTVFNDIMHVADEKNPAGILQMLENKMNELLHYDINDGMDMILVSLDPETGEMDFSGAMRPLVYVHDKKAELHRSGRDTIGGANTHKTFTNHSIKLQKGDCVYFYTDGYIDQFGGPRGRKLHTRGLLNLIEQLTHTSMHEQGKQFEFHFNEWKNDEPQTDDVLLIGFRWS